MGEMKKEERGSWADPSALGLFGLAIVTLVACSQKLGITDGTAAVMGWAIFLGGCAQLIAGLIDLRKNNAFGGTAFITYGLFWLAMAFGWATTNGMFGSYAAETFDPRQTGAAFVAYLILTAFMTIGALRTTKVLFFIFLAIDFLFVGLALSAFGVAREATHMLAAISELVISLLSFYCAGANILNNHFGEQFLSLGNPFWSKKS